MTTHGKPHLTGKEGKEFDLELSASWTKNHREKHPEHPVSHFFGKEILEKILAQEGNVGIRFYHGYDETGKRHLIMAGATSDGHDQLNTVAMGAEPFEAHIVGQEAQPCPGTPGCPTNRLSGN